jgi:zinc protease
MWVGVGSGDETPDQAGLAHVLEHMLFKGTERREVGRISQDVENAGGLINAWTSHDETVFHITLASRFKYDGLDILADAIMHSSLDGDELAKELLVIREEIRMGMDIPQRVLAEKLFDTVYRRHPYKRPIIGYDHTVESFARKDVRDFYGNWYVPSNMVLVVCGDFEPAAMLKKISWTFRGFEGQKTPLRTSRVKEPKQRELRSSHTVLAISESHLGLGFQIPGFKHDDVPALDLLCVIAGQGASCRLETIVRRRLGLVSEIRAMAYNPRDTGVFSVFATTQPHHLEPAVRAIVSQMARIASEPCSLSEVERARALLESDKVYSEETVDSIARKLGYFSLHLGDIDYEKRYLAALKGLGPQELLQAAQKYLSPDKMSISTVIPDPSVPLGVSRIPWTSGKGKNRRVEGFVLRKALKNAVARAWKPLGKIEIHSPRSLRISIKELPTGDTLIVQADPGAKLVSTRAAFLGGQRHEPKSNAGLAMLLAAVLTRGTQTRSADKISRLMDRLACSISGFSGRNTLGVQGDFLAANFKQGFALMADCLRRPALIESEITREKELLIDEIRSIKDNPGQLIFDLFAAAMYGTHPYGRPLQGTIETVSAIDKAAMRRFLNAATAQGSMVIAVVGGVETDSAAHLVQKHLIESGRRASPFKGSIPWNPPAKPRDSVCVVQKEQSHIIIGFPGTRFTSRDRFALEILSEILGGHGGRLFARIREELGLAYSVTSVLMEGIEPGYLALYCATSPGREEQVIGAMLQEIKQICMTAPKSEDVQRVKRHLIGARAIMNQRGSARAANMALGHLYGIGYDAAERYAQRIEAVTLKMLAQAAARYLDLNRMVVSCVGPGADKINLFP